MDVFVYMYTARDLNILMLQSWSVLMFTIAHDRLEIYWKAAGFPATVAN